MSDNSTYHTIDKPRVVVICGPTGVGKTTIAIELAKRYHGEIVGADSMQIYRHMDIGTAKPTLSEQAQIPHHMIDIINPDDPFNAAQYAKMARGIILDIDKKGIIPFVVGGTGFYIKALFQGLFKAPPINTAVRKRLQDEASIHGLDTLHKRLYYADPEGAKKIHPNDGFRIVRALEVLETTGYPISEFHKNHQFFDEPFQTIHIGLHMEREVLYERINQRVDMMIDSGFVKEVRGLLSRSYSSALKPMMSIGYRHMVDFISGQLDWKETVRVLKRDTRRYAKRQLTWFKKDPRILWLSPDHLPDMHQHIDEFLNG